VAQITRIPPRPVQGAQHRPTPVPKGPSTQTPNVAPAQAKPPSVGHPGFAESLIPVWGSGREALADYQEGDYAGAALNGALAASDLFLAGDIAKAVGKSGLYALHGPWLREAGKRAFPNKFFEAPEKQTWKAVSRYMHDTVGPGGEKLLRKGYEGHHWLIPHKGWGKAFPDWLKNHPWNIKELEVSRHQRIHRMWKGEPRFGPIERTWVGMPAWSKVVVGQAAGHPAAEIEKQAHRR
jgi:hypothetical protein